MPAPGPRHAWGRPQWATGTVTPQGDPVAVTCYWCLAQSSVAPPTESDKLLKEGLWGDTDQPHSPPTSSFIHIHEEQTAAGRLAAQRPPPQIYYIPPAPSGR